MLHQLADRLVEQQQGQAVFTAGVARHLNHPHRPQPGDFVQQEEDTALHPPIGLIGRVQQSADDDPAQAGGGLEDLKRNLHEHGQAAVAQLTGSEGLA